MVNSDRMIALLHDLKNPLIAIERLSERLLEGNSSLSDDSRHKIRLVYDSAVQAVEQIEKYDLSSLAESKLDKTCPSSTSVNLAKMGGEVVESFRAHAACKNQTLDFAVAASVNDEDCLVLGDPIQLRKALNAIVSNAVKYSPHGEKIVVRIRLHDDTVCFSVRDNGPGLSEDAQRRAFEPFRQVGPEPTGNESSTGVGLYIARRIVNEHDGAIEVESRQGAGSTFALHFPAAGSASDFSRSHLGDRPVNVSDAPVRHGVS